MNMLEHLVSEIKANQETMQAEMKATLIASRDEVIMINANKENVEVTRKAGQQKLEATISFIRYSQTNLKESLANGRGTLRERGDWTHK
jgi:hypothetical protein